MLLLAVTTHISFVLECEIFYIVIKNGRYA